MLAAGDRNLAILDASSTNCVSWPSVSMLDVLPADFCEFNQCTMRKRLGPSYSIVIGVPGSVVIHIQICVL